MRTRPKVSVLCITYNQEKYIAQAIESFIVQKTDFKFEVIVSDDCSTDSTAQIIQKYARAYPNIIRPILRQKNIGIQNNFIETFRAAKGDYIALCEGDDYWTDPIKLQRQVDFLKNHPEYALCFHPVRIFFEGGEERDSIYPADKTASKFTTKELLRRNFIQTNSVMYRKQRYQKLPNNILPVDWYFHLFHAQFGKIGFINQVMSAYRRHAGGVWFDNYTDINQLWRKHGIAHLALFIEIMKLYGDTDEHRAIIYSHINNALGSINNVGGNNKNSMLEEVVKKLPDDLPIFLRSQLSVLNNREKQLKKMTLEAYALAEKAENLKQIVKTQAQEVELIKASRFWRLRNFVVKHLGGETI